MSEHAQHGMHPDVDVLSAFGEGALAEHERLACLDHLAACAQCREIVYLAQGAEAAEAAPEEKTTPEPVPFWKRWLAPVPVLSTAAVAALLAVSILVYRHETVPSPAEPELMARVEAPPAEAPASVEEKAPLRPPPVRKEAVAPDSARPTPAAPEPMIAMDAAEKTVPTAPLPVAAPPSPPPQAAPHAPITAQSFAPSTAAPFAAPAPNQLSGVTGTITDPAGAAVANAQVKLTDSAGDKTFNVATNSSGQYAVTGVPPGLYELSVNSPGFKRVQNQVDLQPEQVAKADSVLTLGSVAESIEVTAEVASVQTSASAAGRGGRGGVAMARLNAAPVALKPVSLNAASGKIIVRAEASGTLFRSTNSGKSWKAVKGKWEGKVVRVVTPPDAPGAVDAVFQLNTNMGEVWFSRDGNRWTAAPAH